MTPLRVLFDGRERSTTVFLSNRTSTQNTYRISLVNRRMLPDGDIVPADEAGPGEYFADEMISFSPRRVSIAPQSAQTIRLLVRRPRGNFPENVEFRTHMSIQSIPPTPRLEDLETNDKLIEEQRLLVQPVVTVETVIPVLIRFGNPQATIALTNPRLKLRGPELSEPQLVVDLVRAGDRSVYGDLEVFHVRPDGSRESIYVSRGLAVYCPLEVRTKTIRMKGVDPAGLTTGSLLVRFEETPEMNGDQVAELVVPLSTETASLR
ncbi:MAG TPA: hypothetical protein PLH84_02265 [Candidatus Krumholzibacteria bacterium]|nr:hypothetical protein [Candidatus Krumholzibacteria bacterium]